MSIARRLSELPKAWSRRKIGEFAEVQTGSTPNRNDPANYGGTIPWVTTTEVRDDVVLKTRESLTERGQRMGRCKRFPAGSILVAMYGQGATRGRTALLGMDATTNQACAVVRPSPAYETRFLWWFLRAEYNTLRNLGRGGNQPNLNLGMLRAFPVLLPPLPEQRRIADLLDRADAVRRKRQEAIKLTEEFLRSAFLEMFGDPVTNPKGWPVVRMAEVVTGTQYGTAEKAHGDGRGLPVLRMNNITYHGGLDLTSLKWCPVADADLAKHTVRRGDLLFNRTNSPELVGKTAVWDRDDAFAYAGYLVRARFDRDRVQPEYVSGFLNSTYGKRYLFVKAKPSNNMSNFSASEFRRIPLPVPSIAVQNRFVRLLGTTRKSAAVLAASAELEDDLFNSLVQRAFKGEL